MSAQTTAPDALKDAVLTQVEFYLSNSNLPFDKFLFGLWATAHHDPAAVIAKTPAPADSPKDSHTAHNSFHLGWLPLDKLASFKRMQPYLEEPPTGLGSVDAIAEVVKGSSLVEVHKFGADGETGAGWYVRRKSPLTKPADAMERSVYAKGFPATEKDGETDEEREKIRAGELDLQKKLEQWARDLDVGKVLSLRMRREDKITEGKNPLKGKGKFKGSVFIEFAEKESADKFVKLDPKPTFEGKELETMSKWDYVEMKRKLHAPDSAPLAREGKDAIPKNPYTKSTKPFNAWAEKLVSDVDGWPSVPSAASAREGNSKKRAAEDGSEEREIFYDGVKFTARRTGGKSGSIELVDEDKIGKGEGQWPTGKVLRFTISKKDGATDGDKEDGERFDFGALKQRLEPIARPGFVSLVDERPIAGLPGGDKDMKDAPAEKSEFPTRLTAPPTIATASEAKKEDEPEAPAKGRGEQQYPAKGQASFKDVLSDEQFAKLKSEVAEVEGRKIEWVRVSEADERAHQLSRARYHAQQAFEPRDGGFGGRGGRGGRGGGRGGRGGRGGNRGGNKRQRRD
ncbi:hypothetical protein DMC30DRAFT_202321 [Rhodotorula diobovata]|uniref:Lupus La protein n=1 Tax=Rhodotorula diobovata TaxID=5288 RepID=A0A5C5FWT7_9BASI|nr:hypothetical protein DMC30DRAFT_202321 [Rhodotorula diobovata]